MPDITMTAIVTGASRGFGRGIATALTQAGAQVVGVARDHDQLAEVQAELGGSFVPVTGDATDPGLATQLIGRYRPRLLVLNAGATPPPREIRGQTWQTFGLNWDVDVRHVFHWAQAALLAPLPAGSTVITMSSGAALAGSPLSGGYAGAKATIRFLTAYAAAEADRDGLGIRFVSVLPQLTPATGLGATYVAAYAARAGGPAPEPAQALSTGQAGAAIVALATDPGLDQPAYLLTAAGLRPVP